MNSEIFYWFLLSIFLSQLMVVSYVVSKYWRRSRKRLLTSYPYETFPNLYVHSSDIEYKRLETRKWLDYISLIIGAVTFVYCVASSLNTSEIAQLMIYIAALQMVPLIYSAVCCSFNASLMKKRFPKKKRVASFDGAAPVALLPKVKIIVVLCMYALTIYIGNIVSDQTSEIIEVDKIFQLQVLNTALLLVMLALVSNSVWGKRKDNFADPQEDDFKRSRNVHYILNGLIVFNAFMAMIWVVTFYQLENSAVMMLTSVVVQLVVFSTRNQYFPINPSVYKDVTTE